MSNLENVAYCGLYCRLCANKSRTPQHATALHDVMADDGWEFYGEYAIPGFKTFWDVLKRLKDFAETCPDCRGGCGDPECSIRICATDRNIDLCPFCEDFPCEHINALAKRYPNLISDGERLKNIGVETWVSEQEERRRKGFCYCDIRFPPDIEHKH